MTHQQLTEKQSAKACMMGVFLLNSFHYVYGSFSSLWIRHKEENTCQKLLIVWLEQTLRKTEKD